MLGLRLMRFFKKNKIKKISVATILGSLYCSSPITYASNNQDQAEGHLSKEEKMLIEEKKDAILYLLFENNELEPYLEALREQKKERLKKEEFESRFPFTTHEIKERREATLLYEKAANEPISEKNILITEEPYDPDSKGTIEINVAANNPSSLSFFDYEGNPWPISGDIIGDPNAFTSTVFTENKNVAVFSILKRFAGSVALIHLEGLQNLVVVKLIGNESTIDSDKRIRVNRLSPLAENDIVSISNENSSQHNPIFDKLLSGEYSDIGTELEVVNNPNRNNVYIRYNGNVYLRVKHSVVFPMPISHHVSSNGFNLYKLNDTNTITMNVSGDYKIYTLREKK